MRRNAFALFWVILFGSLLSACDNDDKERQASPDTLRKLATDRQLYIGAAVYPHLLDETRYTETLAREFNSITPENHFKWLATEPEPGEYHWEGGDRIAAFARANGQKIRGHTLVWPNSFSHQQFGVLPDYVLDASAPETLQNHIDAHIEAVVTRYADVTDRWDVINEPLRTLSAGVDPNHITVTLGEEWIVRAFQQTHALDPDADLYVNEALAESPGNKHEALLALVQRLLDAGAPIHGIGLQGHFLGGPPAREDLESVLRDWQELGLKIAITELDIPVRDGDFERQAAQYADVMGACLAVEACIEITLWGFTDRHTWLNDFMGDHSAPLIFDADYQPKPAYRALHEALSQD